MTIDNDLIPADPHGILQRHRELLAAGFEDIGQPISARRTREGYFDGMTSIKAALIALAKLDAEKGLR